MPSSLHELRAAAAVIGIIGVETAVPVDRIHAAFGTHPSSGEFGVSDLWRGLDLLTELGLAERCGQVVRLVIEALDIGRSADPILRLLERWLFNSQPLWLSLAVSELAVQSELIPDRALNLISRCTSNTQQRDELLLAAAAKVDVERREEVGAAGEEAVVAAARTALTDGGQWELAQLVERVSLVTDALGYDVVTPGFDAEPRHLEVKTAASSTTRRFYISRSEFNRGLRDPRWFIVLCHLKEEGDVGIHGWLPIDRIADRMPSDVDGGARWETAIVSYELSMVEPGLPL